MFERFITRLAFILFGIIVFMAISNPAKADLNYNTYAISTYAPTLEFPYYDSSTGYNTDGSNTSPYGLGTTVLSSGTISAPSGYYWGTGYVLDSGRADSVAVEFTGYITWPGTTGQETTVYFGVSADDGVFMNIDGTNVITDWQQQGTATWNATGSLTRTAGEQYEITVWMYEWGGGAALDINYSLTDYSTTNQVDMPASWFSTTASTPTYSSAPTAAQTSLRTTTRAITHDGNGIYIDQIGDNLDLTIVQDGQDNLIAGTDTTTTAIADAEIAGDGNTISLEQKSDDNVLLFDVDGNYNNLTVSQGNDLADGGGNRAIIGINGGYNDVSLTQKNSGFEDGQFAKINVTGDDNYVVSTQQDSDKMLFIDITGSDSSLTTNQKGTGNHFLDVSLGSDQTLSVTQEGSGNHAATIALDGYSTSLQLNQNSSSNQTYSIDQTCANANGCGTTIITQN